MPIREISVEELSKAIAEGRAPALVDVRTEGENAVAAIEPCTLVPLHELPGRVEELEALRGKPVVVYCHHGVRSRSGAAILEAAGFTDVASLRGGIDAWSIRIDPRVPRY
jgi:rhodanese-related sulfurtransferase